MSDLTEWLKERRTIHNAATEGPWAIGSWRDRSFQHHMTIEPEAGHRTIGDVTDDHQGNATAIVDAHNTLPALLTAVEKVLELHKPFEWSFGYGPVQSCTECSRLSGNEGDSVWPCPTVRSIEGTINEQ